MDKVSKTKKTQLQKSYGIFDEERAGGERRERLMGGSAIVFGSVGKGNGVHIGVPLRVVDRFCPLGGGIVFDPQDGLRKVVR